MLSIRKRFPTEYGTWRAMLQRCYNEKCSGYKYYGARGIRVWRPWAFSFEQFLADMGPKPTPDLTIERINNNGHYLPTNCRWATRKEQGRNRRSNRLLTVGGRTQPVVAWAEEAGISSRVIGMRIERDRWDVGRAVSSPVKVLRRPGEPKLPRRRAGRDMEARARILALINT